MSNTRKSIFKDAKVKEDENKNEKKHHNKHHRKPSDDNVSIHNDINIVIEQPKLDKEDEPVEGCFKAMFKCIK